MKKIQGLLGSIWRPLLGFLAVVLVLYLVLFSRLGTLVPGLHPDELSAYSSSSTLNGIIENPVNAPHKLLQLALVHLGDTGAFWLRAASAVFAAAAIGLFFFLLQRWHTTRIAFLGTVLFATSSAFLHAARLGTPSVLLSFAILVLLAVGVRLEREKPGSAGLLVLGMAFSLILYIPGFVWLVLAGVVWRHKKVIEILSPISWLSRVGIGMVVLIALSPLAIGSFHEPGILRDLAGLPSSWPSPLEYLKNLAYVPLGFFIRSIENPSAGLGKLPILDIFASAMFALGAYAHWFTRKSERTQFLFGSLILGSLLIALQGSVNGVLLVPVVYAITAAGITLLLQQWFTVFPRNPLARSVGISLVTLAVLTASFYHFNRYFVAWANAPETRQVFTVSSNQVQ